MNTDYKKKYLKKWQGGKSESHSTVYKYLYKK